MVIGSSVFVLWRVSQANGACEYTVGPRKGVESWIKDTTVSVSLIDIAIWNRRAVYGSSESPKAGRCLAMALTKNQVSHGLRWNSSVYGEF